MTFAAFSENLNFRFRLRSTSWSGRFNCLQCKLCILVIKHSERSLIVHISYVFVDQHRAEFFCFCFETFLIFLAFRFNSYPPYTQSLAHPQTHCALSCDQDGESVGTRRARKEENVLKYFSGGNLIFDRVRD